MEDDEAQAAKAELFTAIRHYYQQVEPDEYVTGYVLITHRDTQGSVTEDNSYVGVIAPDGQSFVITRGLLVIGNESTALEMEEEG